VCVLCVVFVVVVVLVVVVVVAVVVIVVIVPVNSYFAGFRCLPLSWMPEQSKYNVSESVVATRHMYPANLYTSELLRRRLVCGVFGVVRDS
jgi:hypothetical protein